MRKSKPERMTFFGLWCTVRNHWIHDGGGGIFLIIERMRYFLNFNGTHSIEKVNNSAIFVFEFSDNGKQNFCNCF